MAAFAAPYCARVCVVAMAGTETRVQRKVEVFRSLYTGDR